MRVLERLLATLLQVACTGSSFAATWYVNGTVGRDWYAGGVRTPKQTI